MIKYHQIPQDITTQQEVRLVRRKCPNWSDRKMLSSYMDAYSRGVKSFNENKDLYEQKLELTYIAIYYIIRKEFLQKLTPFVILRGKDFLACDNSSLLHRLDQCLKAGVESCPDESKKCIDEIRNRLQ